MLMATRDCVLQRVLAEKMFEFRALEAQERMIGMARLKFVLNGEIVDFDAINYQSLNQMFSSCFIIITCIFPSICR